MGRIKNIRSILLLLAFQLGWNVRFNIVGSITLSEIFLLLYAFQYAWKDPLLKTVEYRKISFLYLALFCVQCIMEFIVGNSFNNAAKGIAVTVVSFCHVYFLVKIFLRDRSLVFWSLAFSVFAMILQGSQFEAEASVEETLEGESASYLKFYLAPLITKIALAVSCVYKGRWSYYLFIYLGIVFVVAGARSSGVMILLTGLMGWIVASGRMISLRKLSGYFLFGTILGYGLYVVYVDNVLSGNIKAGNSEQLLETQNPYNPISLLMAGRPEFFVGYAAFLDKPLTGWGAWKKDSELGYKYHKMRTEIKSKDFSIKKAKKQSDSIPNHSVWIGYGTNNGILAFILISLIIAVIVNYALRLMLIRDTYIIVIVYYLFFIFWNFVFSPVSHFRNTLPLCIAFILASYMFEKYKTANNDANIVAA